MTVWIVNPFDNLPTEGNRPQRYWLMARAFAGAGHQVVYWTSDFSHATKQRRRHLVPGSDEGFEVIEVTTLPYAKNVCLARARSHRRLARDFERQAESRLESSTSDVPSLIVSSVPPLGLCDAARRVARRHGALFVADIQDAWPETFERILPRFVWSLLGLRRTARRIYREADGVSAVARRYLELAKDYGSVVPAHLAGHVIDRRATPRTRREIGRPNRLKLVYVGNMSVSYDLETVIKAVRGLPDVTLDVAGNGPDRERLEKLACDAVRFHGYLGEADLATLLRGCDVGVVPMFPESRVGVPGKLADYAAAGLLVIESLGGECQEIVESCNVGVHYRVGDVEDFKMSLSRLAGIRVPPSGVLDAFARGFDSKLVMGGYVRWTSGLVARKGMRP